MVDGIMKTSGGRGLGYRTGRPFRDAESLVGSAGPGSLAERLAFFDEDSLDEGDEVVEAHDTVSRQRLFAPRHMSHPTTPAPTAPTAATTGT